ncbi:hypothetical protein CCM_05323 [Cordyceps militaris CM01]|uniref:WSC domain-containing protein n=1 Tax=Cordyceps militaris (strain CM01) TaxID=983644 RepID=G3JJ18_CORMM|nr:uncharacterized protein CCM_05323 [Cordyceps militaris CM01]EGX91165.1 hypothetical protein CCM_05323 [Cordyceps militaris CM01]
MQMSIILAAGVGRAVMAAVQMPQNGTATPAAASLMSMPETVGEFDLVGCAGDGADFANFQMVAQSALMSLNLCAASCPNKYFATHDDECHCADATAEDMTQTTPSSCAIPCPGNDKEACGGAAAALSSRGAGGKLCTVYVRRPKPKVQTKIEYHVHTITACPPTVVHCPAAPHVTTETKTITTEVCPEPEWHKKKIVCYGGHCAPEYPCHGEDCKRERVICHDEHCWTETCDEDEDWSKLVIYKGDDDCHYAPGCRGDDCNRKVVCYDGKCVIEKCVDDECSKNLLCHDDHECHHAKCDNGEQCHQKMMCHGNDCSFVPPCYGEHCPKAPLPKPSGSKPTPAPGYYNKGDNEHNGCHKGDHENDGCDKGDNEHNGCHKGDHEDNRCNKGDNEHNGYNKGDNEHNGYNKADNEHNGYNKGSDEKIDYNHGNNGKSDQNGDYGCHLPYCKPAPGGSASSTGAPRPTYPPMVMVGGAERNGATLFGVLAGFAMLL